jgi:hypothetical protein
MFLLGAATVAVVAVAVDAWRAIGDDPGAEVARWRLELHDLSECLHAAEDRSRAALVRAEAAEAALDSARGVVCAFDATVRVVPEWTHMLRIALGLPAVQVTRGGRRADG